MANTKPSFAEPIDLAEWLGETIEENSADWKRAIRCLRLASSQIRRQTGRDWIKPDSMPLELLDDVPEDLEDIACAAAGRFYTNPDSEISWNSQIDDGLDGGSRKVDETGVYLTASEKAVLDDLVSDSAETIGGIGVIGTTRNELSSLDMSREWFDGEDFLHMRVTG